MKFIKIHISLEDLGKYSFTVYAQVLFFYTVYFDHISPTPLRSFPPLPSTPSFSLFLENKQIKTYQQNRIKKQKKTVEKAQHTCTYTQRDHKTQNWKL